MNNDSQTLSPIHLKWWNLSWKFVGIALILGSFVFFGVGFYRLFVQPKYPFVCDLELRWNEIRVLWEGTNPADVYSTADYPPWAYGIGSVVVPPLPWPVTRILFGGLNVLGLAYLAFWSASLLRKAGATGCLPAVGASWCLISHAYCLSNGQYGILMVVALILLYESLVHDRQLATGVFYALVLIKPHLGAFWGPILLFQKRYRSIGYGTLALGILSLPAWVLIGDDPISLVVQMFSRSQEFAVQGQGLARALAAFTEITDSQATFSLMFTGWLVCAFFLWKFRSSSILIQFGIAGVFALLSGYQKAYDHMVIVFLGLGLLTQIHGDNRSTLKVVAWVMLTGFLALPFKMYQHGFLAVQASQAALFVFALIALLKPLPIPMMLKSPNSSAGDEAIPQDLVSSA